MGTFGATRVYDISPPAAQFTGGQTYYSGAFPCARARMIVFRLRHTGSPTGCTVTYNPRMGTTAPTVVGSGDGLIEGGTLQQVTSVGANPPALVANTDMVFVLVPSNANHYGLPMEWCSMRIPSVATAGTNLTGVSLTATVVYDTSDAASGAPLGPSTSS